ncbi:unnamed protein product [Nezara viridula]|uniref:Uncharacterized protein n=1 Tax=Nezara viridula TaxID=85310 RepID=A0A9P0MV85_NEZVI|nr:unnamed protein product [Nezara viridula]
MDLLDSNLDLEIVFGGCGALVFVIDAQDDYMDALNKLNVTVTKAFKNSGIEKAFLFDVVSKIYVATDSSPVDMQSYELCCDMIDVVIDISGLYGRDEFIGLRRRGLQDTQPDDIELGKAAGIDKIAQEEDTVKMLQSPIKEI